MKMKSSNYNKSRGSAVSDIIEQLGKEFNSDRFYGLEYIVEDLMKDKIRECPVSNSHDWFGLNDLTRT